MNCQSIAGAPIDEAIGSLVAEEMTPAAVELAIEIRREVLRTSISVLDLVTGEVEIVEQADGPHTPQAGRAA